MITALTVYVISCIPNDSVYRMLPIVNLECVKLLLSCIGGVH